MVADENTSKVVANSSNKMEEDWDTKLKAIRLKLNNKAENATAQSSDDLDTRFQMESLKMALANASVKWADRERVYNTETERLYQQLAANANADQTYQLQLANQKQQTQAYEIKYLSLEKSLQNTQAQAAVWQLKHQQVANAIIKATSCPTTSHDPNSLAHAVETMSQGYQDSELQLADTRVKLQQALEQHIHLTNTLHTTWQKVEDSKAVYNQSEERVVELQLTNESLEKALGSCRKELAQSASKLESGYTNAQLEIGMLKGTIQALQHKLTQVQLHSDTYSECIKAKDVRIFEMRDALATALEEKGELQAAVQRLMVENTKLRGHLYCLADGGGKSSRAYNNVDDDGDKDSDQQKKDDEETRYTSTIAELEGEVATLLGKVKEADQFKAYFKSFKVDVEQLVQVAEHATQHAHQELAAIRHQLEEEQAACSEAQKQCAAAADDAEQYQKVAESRLQETQNAIEAAVKAKQKATNAEAALRMTKVKLKQAGERRREADLHAKALQQKLADIELSYLVTSSELEESLHRKEDAKLQDIKLNGNNSSSGSTRFGISMKAELERTQDTATRLAQQCRQLEERLRLYGDAPERSIPSFVSYSSPYTNDNDPRIANLKAVITNLEMQLADARSANMKLERELVAMDLRLKHSPKTASINNNNNNADTKMKIGRLLRAVDARDAVIATLRMRMVENTHKEDVEVLLGSLPLYNNDNDEWKVHVYQMIKMWRRCVETKNEEIVGLQGEMEAMKGELDEVKSRRVAGRESRRGGVCFES